MWDKWPGASWGAEEDRGGGGKGHEEKDQVLKGKSSGRGILTKL